MHCEPKSAPQIYGVNPLIARPFPGIITEEEIISMTEMQSNQQSRFHDPCKTPPLQGNYKIAGNPKFHQQGP
jgi:hypothetical protein